MASAALRSEDVVGLINSAQEGRPLPMVYFLDSPAEPASMTCAFLLKHRPGGFMSAMPRVPAVEEQLQALTGDGVEQPLLFSAAEMPCETSRRRAVGPVTVFLVDAPWNLLAYFRKASFGRGSLLQLRVILSGGTAVRPVSAEALAVADSWVLAAMDDPSQSDAGLGEYITGVSQEEPLDEEADPEPETAEVLRLRARVAQLAGGTDEICSTTWSSETPCFVGRAGRCSSGPSRRSRPFRWRHWRAGKRLNTSRLGGSSRSCGDSSSATCCPRTRPGAYRDRSRQLVGRSRGWRTWRGSP